jgi:hypothetical protein
MITREDKLDFSSPHFDPELALHEPNFVTPVNVVPLNRLELCRSLLPPTDPNYQSSIPALKTPPTRVELKPSAPQVPIPSTALDQEEAKTQSLPSSPPHTPTKAQATARKDILELIAGM